jgi:hypothetical protein
MATLSGTNQVGLRPAGCLNSASSSLEHRTSRVVKNVVEANYPGHGVQCTAVLQVVSDPQWALHMCCCLMFVQQLSAALCWLDAYVHVQHVCCLILCQDCAKRAPSISHFLMFASALL